MSLGNWGKFSEKWVLDAILRKDLFVPLDPSLPFSTLPCASGGSRGRGAKLCGPRNKYSNSILHPPFGSLLGLPIGQPNWKPLGNPTGSPRTREPLDLVHTTSLWDWLGLATTNNWRPQLLPRRPPSASSPLPDSCNHSLPSLPIPGLPTIIESRRY